MSEQSYHHVLDNDVITFFEHNGLPIIRFLCRIVTDSMWLNLSGQKSADSELRKKKVLLEPAFGSAHPMFYACGVTPNTTLYQLEPKIRSGFRRAHMSNLMSLHYGHPTPSAQTEHCNGNHPTK